MKEIQGAHPKRREVNGKGKSDVRGNGTASNATDTASVTQSTQYYHVQSRVIIYPEKVIL